MEAEGRANAMLEGLRETLKKHGYQAKSLPPENVVEHIREMSPDAVLLSMAVDECVQLCRKLREEPQLEHLPVILVQPEDTPACVQELDCGASDFMAASLPEAELLARLQASIRTWAELRKAEELNRQLTKTNQELFERNRQIEKELYVARQLQQSLLPPFIQEDDPALYSPLALSKCHYRDEKVRITGLYVPCDALGGDLYDVLQFSNGAIGVTIADVSGHGVPAGFITAIFKSSFYRLTHNHPAPGELLFHLNNEMSDIVKTGEYVTALYGLVQPDEAEPGRLNFLYSGAGHPYPLYYNAAARRLERLQENGTPLVWFKDMEYHTARIPLSPGDKILLFTDGVTEMRNGQGRLFGEEVLEQKFQELVASGEPHLLDMLVQHLSDFTEGHPLEDDLSLVLIELAS